MKICPRCNLSKGLDDFYKGTNRDGLMSWCKDCFCEHKRIEYQQSTKIRDEARSRERARYQNDVQFRAKSIAKKRSRRHSQEGKAYHRTYKQMHTNQTRMHSQTRRARKLGQFIEDVDPRVVYEMHGGMCGICKRFIDGEFHVDHVIPLSKGGMHGYVNVQPAHPICNLEKGATP